MLSQDAHRIAAHQRARFNQLANTFDVPQPAEVIERLRQVVAAAGLRPGKAVLDVGTGAGVLIPLIEACRPAAILACDVSEEMLARVRRHYPQVRVLQCDIVWCALRAASVDAVFMNAMFGNIADKTSACREAERILQPHGRLIVSHPEGRAFVDELRATTDLIVEPLPARAEFEQLLAPLRMEMVAWRDEPKLYLMAARKTAPPAFTL
jgi:ubiquinone/menaquinone biosynthesis C-methylase UbiE